MYKSETYKSESLLLYNMQAIIFADRFGSGSVDCTADIPKCMVEVNGVKLIDRVISQLSRLRVDRIIIVDGYKNGILRDHVEQICKDIPILFIENDLYATTNSIFSLWLAIHYLLDDDTILIESDMILEDSVLESLWKSAHKNVALISKYESPVDGTLVEIDSEDNITAFIPKEQFNDSDVNRYYKTVNLYKFSPEFIAKYFLPFLEAYMNAFGTDDNYEEVLRIITSVGKFFIKGQVISSDKWHKIDDADDLNNAAKNLNY